jgi:hypothetical protein
LLSLADSFSDGNQIKIVMTNKAKELELQNVMEGLQEFATFMSYQSDYSNLKILSVESVEQAKITDAELNRPKADVIPISKAQQAKQKEATNHHKSLRFFDKVVH